MAERLNESEKTKSLDRREELSNAASKFVEDIGETIKEANIGKTVSENPWILILGAAGVGLLLGTRNKKKYRKPYRQEIRPSRALYDSRAAREFAERDEDSGDFTEAISSSASAAYETVSDAAGSAYKKAGEWGGQIKHQYSDSMQENPLVVGAIALAAGAVVGMMIPSTEYENELMGDMRDNLMTQATDKVSGVMDEVQNTVGQITDTISEVRSQFS